MMADHTMAQIEHKYEEYLNHRKDEDDGLEDVIVAIEEHLSLVRHQNKFGFEVFLEVFDESKRSGKDGDKHCKKFPDVWRTVARYAENVLSQPWRPEFRTLKLFSGYYKHKIAPYIDNMPRVFRLMGYKECEVDTYVLKEPIDTSPLLLTALDCMIASVECKLMLEIQEKVKSRRVSWYEVAEARAYLPGTVQDTVRFIENGFRYTYPTNNYVPTYPSYMYPMHGYHGGDYSRTVPYDPTPPPPPHPHPLPYYNYHHPPVLHSHQVYPDPSGYSSRYPPMSYMRPDSQLSFETDPRLLPRTIPHRKRERTEPSSTRIHQKHEVPPTPPKELYQSFTQDEHIEASLACLKHDQPRLMKEDATEDWNYVYNGLGHQGYTKDLGERGNVLLKDTTGGLSPSFSSEHSSTYEKKASRSKPVATNHHCLDLITGSRPDYKSLNKNHHNHLHLDITAHAKNHTAKKEQSPSPSGCKTPIGGHAFNLSDVEIHVNKGSNQSGSKHSDSNGSVSDGKGQELSRLMKDMQVASSKEKYYKHNTNTPEKSSKDHAKEKLMEIKPNKESGQPIVIDEKSLRDKPHEPSSGKARDKENVRNERANMWSCNSCTFNNKAEQPICQMCFKSRTKGQESVPLDSGGRECPHCTLINKKEAKKCEVCAKDLDGSPTYV